MDENMEPLGQDTEISYDKLFRSSMFGFNKEDVLSYLKRIARSKRKESERYASHIRMLETQVEELKRTASELSESQAGQSTGPSAGVLASENEALRSENDVLRQRVEIIEKELAQAKAMSAEVTESAEAPMPVEVPAAVTEDDAEAYETRIEQLKERYRKIERCLGPTEQNRADPAENTALGEKLNTCEAEDADDRVRLLEEKVRAYELEKARFSEIEAAAYENARIIEESAKTNRTELEAETAERAEKLHGTLKVLSESLDKMSGVIYRELSESGTRYTELRREMDALLQKIDGVRF